MRISTCTERLLNRFVSLRPENTKCVELSSSKDSEALCKFLQFSTRVNVLCDLKTEKLLICLLSVLASLNICKTMLSPSSDGDFAR